MPAGGLDRPLTRNEAIEARDAIVRTLRSFNGAGEPNSSVVPALAAYCRDIVRTLGDSASSDLRAALSEAFNLSEFDSARLLTDDPSPTPFVSPPDADLATILGAESFCSRYLDLTAESESPAQYHLASLLTAASGALQRRCMIDMQLYQVYPNLYTVLVGRSGIKKDTAIDLAVRLVAEAQPGLHVLPKEASPQGFVESLRDRSRDSGIADGLLISEELGVTLGKEEYKRELGKWLTDLYKCPDLWERRLRGGGRITLPSVYIAILAASTPEWLRRIPDDLLTGGFFPRVWVVHASRKRGWKWRTPIDATRRAELVELLRFRLAAPHVRLHLSAGANGRMSDWYERELPLRQASAPKLMEGYFERLHILVLKLAAILHVVEGFDSNLIGRGTVEQAIRLASITESGVETTMRDVSAGRDGELVRDVLDVLRESGGRMRVRELVRTLQLRHAKAKVAECVNTLVYSQTLAKVAIGGEEAIMLLDPDAR